MLLYLFHSVLCDVINRMTHIVPCVAVWTFLYGMLFLCNNISIFSLSHPFLLVYIIILYISPRTAMGWPPWVTVYTHLYALEKNETESLAPMSSKRLTSPPPTHGNPSCAAPFCASREIGLANLWGLCDFWSPLASPAFRQNRRDSPSFVSWCCIPFYQLLSNQAHTNLIIFLLSSKWICFHCI